MKTGSPGDPVLPDAGPLLATGKRLAPGRWSFACGRVAHYWSGRVKWRDDCALAGVAPAI